VKGTYGVLFGIQDKLIMFRNLPVILGVGAIIGLTIAEAKISGRFQSSNVTSEQFTTLLKNVPMDIGDWHGEDLPVEDQVRKTAGARGYVSRVYRNSVTGEEATIWLIVGHSRDVMRHTPDVCYPSSGFKTRAPENSRHTFVFEGQPPADFYTNTFVKEDATGRHLIRVFWSWFKPQEDGTVTWKAPKIVRLEIGNTPSLYKLYFTSNMRDGKESTEDSQCNKFAEVFLPVVEKALSTTSSASDTPSANADDDLLADPPAATDS
jgi:hypothetical protein